MKIKVYIQQNEFIAQSIETTQEDNFGEIVDKYELYELKTQSKVGMLVRYFNGKFKFIYYNFIRHNFHDLTKHTIIFDLPKEQVKFSEVLLKR